MTRINMVVEGPTEESFVKNILAREFWSSQIILTPILLGVPGHKGGRPNYARVKKDILLHLKQDQTAYCSTMLDFYGLGEGFPGTPVPENLSNVAKASHIENAIKADICAVIPSFRPDIRLLPYIQLHEYEALLFSNPVAFAESIGQPQLATRFQKIHDEFETPEHINNDRETAPSKRVLKAHPRYRKVIEGTLAAHAVGVDSMREACPHFRDWLERLEGLAQY